MTLYEITYERVGRHGAQREGAPPAPGPYQVRAADADELARAIHTDVRRYLGSRYIEVDLDLAAVRGVIIAGGVREVGSFTIRVCDDLEPTAPAVVEPDPVPELPAVTKAGLGYLERFAAAQDAGNPVHVYREYSKPGNGVSRPAFDRLVRDGLVELGDHKALQGRPVAVTALGRAVLAAQEG